LRRDLSPRSEGAKGDLEIGGHHALGGSLLLYFQSYSNTYPAGSCESRDRFPDLSVERRHHALVFVKDLVRQTLQTPAAVFAIQFGQGLAPMRSKKRRRMSCSNLPASMPADRAPPRRAVQAAKLSAKDR